MNNKRYNIVYAERKSLVTDKFYSSFAEVHSILKNGEEVTVAIDYRFEGKWYCEGYKVIGKDRNGVCWTQRAIAQEY